MYIHFSRGRGYCMKKLHQNGFTTKVRNKKVLLIGAIGVILAIICIGGYLISRHNKEELTCHIKVNGFEVEYIFGESSLTLQDFEQLELGMSVPEIEGILGEADAWIGCGNIWPVYILHDGTAVECFFNGPDCGLNIIRWTNEIYSKVIKTSENLVQQIELTYVTVVRSESGEMSEYGKSLIKLPLWWQLRSQEEYNRLIEEAELEPEDIALDFKKHFYIWTYGRPIKELYCDTSLEYCGNANTMAVFDMTIPYASNMIYIYEMGKHFLEEPEYGWGDIKCLGMCSIEIDGLTATYLPGERFLTLEDFEQIKLGSSISDIEKMLGDYDAWIGENCMTWPVYILADETAVVCYFDKVFEHEDLVELVWFDREGNSKVIKSKVE